MKIYQIWATVGPDKDLQTGAILARNKQHAIAVAVDKVKKQFGSAGKVLRIIEALDVSDMKRLRNSGFWKLLTDLENCLLVSYHVEKLIQIQIGMIDELRNLIKERMKDE